jgi:hypothetical protein
MHPAVISVPGAAEDVPSRSMLTPIPLCNDDDTIHLAAHIKIAGFIL